MKANDLPTTGLLIGKKAIKHWLGITSDELFLKWIDLGLPIRVVDKRYYAYTENLETFFKVSTNVVGSEIPEDAE